MKLTSIKLVRVRYMPNTLEAGVLYFSEEFDSVLHLCACGCGAKISTPLGPTEWALEEDKGPTLRPSVGNWQLPCKSHYWIEGGLIVWDDTWTPEQVATGRREEGQRRKIYYDNLVRGQRGVFRRLWERLKGLFR